MTKCIIHIVECDDVEDALVNGDQNDFRTGGGDTDISMQDNTGSFDLRGIKCKRCGERVNIYYTQHEEDKKYVEISPDAITEEEERTEMSKWVELVKEKHKND
jgi:hypothetical protein